MESPSLRAHKTLAGEEGSGQDDAKALSLWPPHQLMVILSPGDSLRVSEQVQTKNLFQNLLSSLEFIYKPLVSSGT